MRGLLPASSTSPPPPLPQPAADSPNVAHAITIPETGDPSSVTQDPQLSIHEQQGSESTRPQAQPSQVETASAASTLASAGQAGNPGPAAVVGNAITEQARGEVERRGLRNRVLQSLHRVKITELAEFHDLPIVPDRTQNEMQL